MGNSDFTRTCSTAARLAFAGRWTRSEVNVKGFMPTRIRCRDKVNALTQQPDISMIKTEMTPFLQACYTALKSVFGMLCGYI